MDVSICSSTINLILIYDLFAWFCSASDHFTYVYMLSQLVSVFNSPDDLVFKSGDLLSISRPISHLNQYIGSLVTQFDSTT
jgi:hypothetical protein